MSQGRHKTSAHQEPHKAKAEHITSVARPFPGGLFPGGPFPGGVSSLGGLFPGELKDLGPLPSIGAQKSPYL